MSSDSTSLSTCVRDTVENPKQTDCYALSGVRVCVYLPVTCLDGLDEDRFLGVHL